MGATEPSNLECSKHSSLNSILALNLPFLFGHWFLGDGRLKA